MAFKNLPLVALRAFEAAARHCSYSRAADELGLSHGAVSHHLKALEQSLGVGLFRREGQRMVLTEHGQRLAVHASEGFAHLLRGFEEVRIRQRQSRIVTISVLPALASRWLIDRLLEFQELEPDIEVAMTASPLLVDFSRDGIDMGLRYGAGRWPRVKTDLLFDEQLFPVCSPAFNELKKLKSPEDLSKVKLLHDQRIPWSVWLRSAGLKVLKLPSAGPTYSDAGHLLQAAVAGHGVALARSVLAKPDLEAGRLIRPFEQAVPAEFAYYVAFPDDRPLRQPAALFHAWLLEAAKKTSL
ncbi:LysR family glycine cleavage system transcriptional activator [Bradyrhizobium sp. USDA 4461]